MNPELWEYQKEARENLKSELGIELRTQSVKFEIYLIAIGYNLAKFHNKLYRIYQ